MSQLTIDSQRTRENQAHEMEKIELRLKLEMLQAGRPLSPPPDEIAD